MMTLISQADSSNSSLIANRLARARGPAPSSPPIVTHDGNPSAPISIGALSASDYQPDDTLSLNSRPIQDTEVDAAEEAASPKQISPTPPMAVKTPSWLKPLKLVGFCFQLNVILIVTSLSLLSYLLQQGLPSLSQQASLNTEMIVRVPLFL